MNTLAPCSFEIKLNYTQAPLKYEHTHKICSLSLIVNFSFYILLKFLICLLTQGCHGFVLLLRTLITGMVSGSIVAFNIDFNRWHYEHQNRY